MSRQKLPFAGQTAAAIGASIEDAIHAGRVASGQQLPTIRDVAAHLKVSPATVAAAYRALRSRGLITGDGRRGTRVRPSGQAGVHAAIHVGVHAVAQPAEFRTSGRSISATAGPPSIDLATGNPDPALLPPLDAALRQVPRLASMYGDAPHLPALMTFAASEFAADDIRAEHLTMASGALDAIERVLGEHLRHGDRVAVEDPGFTPLIDLLHANGLLVEPYSIDDEGPVPASFAAALDRRVRAVIVTTRAQNPFGSALTLERAAELRTVLRRHDDVLLVENDPAGPISGAAAIGLADGSRRRWAVVRSTAKFLGPDLRLAFVAGDAITIERVRRRYAVGPRWVSHILQHLVVAMWADPGAGRSLARAAAIYAERREALLRALATRGIQAHGKSGLNVWIPVRQEALVVQSLRDRGWAVAAGERFRLRSGPAIRITTSALAPESAARLAQDVAASLRPPDAPLA